MSIIIDERPACDVEVKNIVSARFLIYFPSRIQRDERGYIMKVSSKKAALEQQLAQIEKELKSIERSAAFKKENAISRALNNLMKKHGCSKNDLISILQGDSAAPAKRSVASSSKTRKPRKLKVFKNPNTGETVETRGGNHKILKAWKSEYNLSNIDEWLVAVKD